MRSSTVPARVSQSRSREPLRWLRRSALRSPCPAPHRASLSNSISRWAAKPIISRRNVASEPFSRSVRRAILSSVIVVILRSELRVQPNPTQDRHGGRRPARPRPTPCGRSSGPISGLLHHHQGHNQNEALSIESFILESRDRTRHLTYVFMNSEAEDRLERWAH